jgi:hypothetical protein
MKKDLRYCVGLESNSIVYLPPGKMFRTGGDAEENETYFISHTILS